MKEIILQLEAFIKKQVDDSISQHPVIKALRDQKEPENYTSRYITRKEAALYIKYSVGTIDKLAREGKLHPIYMFGKKSVRYDKVELDKIMHTFKIRK